MSYRWLFAVVVLLGCDGAEWHGAEPVDDRPRRSVGGADPFPAVAIAGQRAIVVWGTVLLNGYRAEPGTWARWYDGDGWSEPAFLGDRTQRPVLVASSNGTALAWVTDGITHFDGRSWSAPSSADLGTSPQLAMDGRGNALALGTNGADLVITDFAPATGWGPTRLLAENGSAHLVAMSDSGAAIAVWSDGIDVRARLRSSLGIWSTTRTVDTGCSPVAARMFGVDRSVVLARCGSTLRLLRSDAAGGFVGAGEVPSRAYTQLVVNRLGGVLVAASDGNSLSIIHAPPGVPLTAPLSVTASVISPSIGATFGITLDDEENGHILFTEHEGVSRLKGREFDGNARTLRPVVVMDRGTGSAYYPSVAGDPNGNAIVAWNQSGSNPEEIWANLYY